MFERRSKFKSWLIKYEEPFTYLFTALVLSLGFVILVLKFLKI